MTTKTALAIARLLDAPGVGPARVRALVERASAAGIPLPDFIDKSSDVLKAEQWRAVRENHARVADDVAQLEANGVQLVCFLDDNYPPLINDRLGKRAPALLSARGAVALLSVRGVGFCGSRKASDKGLATATDCAAQLGGLRVNVVSGYAAGVDTAAHRAALQTGGTTTIVLAEGIHHFRVRKELERDWSWERALVVSEFAPSTPWSTGNAMQRNRTICAASRAMILIEARDTGGSFAAGEAALEMAMPLFGVDFEGNPETAAGNRILLARGATPLKRTRDTGRANLGDVLAKADGDAAAPTALPTAQMRMF